MFKKMYLLSVISYKYKVVKFIPQKHNIYYQYSIETPVTK